MRVAVATESPELVRPQLVVRSQRRWLPVALLVTAVAIVVSCIVLLA